MSAQYLARELRDTRRHFNVLVALIAECDTPEKLETLRDMCRGRQIDDTLPDLPDLDNIDRNCKETTARMYRRAIEIHLPPDIDYADKLAVESILDERKATITNKIIVYKALYHVCNRDREYSKMYKKLGEEYDAERVEKCTIQDIDWAPIINKLEGKADHESMTVKAWCLLQSRHPRRFTDYWKLSNEEKPDTNLVDGRNVSFRVFKNAGTMTAGDTTVVLDEDVAEYIRQYCEKWDIKGFLFPQNRRRMYHLFKKYGLPTPTSNRKYQENEDLNAGKSVYETAKKFNHSVAVQQVYYKKDR